MSVKFLYVLNHISNKQSMKIKKFDEENQVNKVNFSRFYDH